MNRFLYLFKPYQKALAALVLMLALVCCPVAAQAAELTVSDFGAADVAAIGADSEAANAEPTVGTEPAFATSAGDDAGESAGEDADGESLELLADKIWGSTLTGVTLGTNGIYVYGTVTLAQQGISQTALNSVIAWRKDALDDTSIKFKYNGTWYTVRDYLKKIGMSESAYLSPQWSNALERIAIQRSIECFINFNHTRPDGTSCFSAKYGNVSSEGEVIGQGLVSNISGAISFWASEKAEYVKECKGQSHGETGHYTALINPYYTFYGFSLIDNYSWVGEVASGSSIEGGTSPTNFSGTNYAQFSLSPSSASVSWYNASGKVNGSSTTIGHYDSAAAFYLKTSNNFVLLGTWNSSNPSVATVDNKYSNMVNVTPVSVGTTTISLTSGIKTYSLTVKVIEGQSMYRLYNPYSGEHLFTLDANEYAKLGEIGWKQEGVEWMCPKTSSTPVYRLYNKYSGDHHYTTSKSEYDACVKQGWNGEGIGFYSDDAKGTAVYRLFNRYVTVGTHHYTKDANEYNSLGKIGWNKEGIAWYGLKS